MTTRLEFGEWLRRQREGRGISLKALADQTKVSAALFAALERGDCSRWPSGIYSRAWVRNYALAVGLDPEMTTERFSRCFAETAFPDPAPVEVEHPIRRALRKLMAVFTWTKGADGSPVAGSPAVSPTLQPVAPQSTATQPTAPERTAPKPKGPRSAAAQPVVGHRDQQVAIPQRLVATNVRRQNSKRVVSRRKRRRVERAVSRNATA